MQIIIELVHFVPLPAKSDSVEFESILAKTPVDTSPDRIGQVKGQVLLRHADGRFLWAFARDGILGHQTGITATIEKLASIAAVYARRTLSVIDSKSLNDDNSVLPSITISDNTGYVRVYDISPKGKGDQDSLERCMVEQALPAVDHIASDRVGHSIDGIMFLREGTPGLTAEDPGTYRCMASHGVNQRFSNRFSNSASNRRDDIDAALEKLKEFGDINGINDYQVLELNNSLHKR
jgi:hypothetical protein